MLNISCKKNCCGRERRHVTGSLLFMLTAITLGAMLLPGYCFADEREKKVLILGIDGIRSDAYEVAQTPNMDALIANGAFSLDAQSEDITISGTCWSSILYGVHRDRHEVEGNSDYGDPAVGNNLDAWPDVYSRLESYDPSLVTAQFTRWLNMVETPSNVDINHLQRLPNGSKPSDSQVADEAVLFLSGWHPDYVQNPDVLFVYFGDVDGTGHASGFDPTPGSPYIQSIEAHDTMVGQIMSTVAARPSFAQEEWLTIVTTDHGGIGSSHGSAAQEIRTVPLIVSGDSVVPGEVFPQPRTVDVVRTVLSFMGVPDEQMSDLDGHTMGLSESPTRQISLGNNLLFNSDAEYDRGFDDVTPDQFCSGWADYDANGVSVFRYEEMGSGFAQTPDQAGDNFFTGGMIEDCKMTQTFEIDDFADMVDDGLMSYGLAGYLGGWQTQDDWAELHARFFDESGNSLLVDSLIGPDAATRGNQTTLMPYNSNGTVPVGTRRVEIELGMVRIGAGDCDGYADNLSFVLMAPLDGDANNDGTVDAADASIMATNWLSADAGWGQGDFNGDGKVDDADATILAANWQKLSPGFSASVPEPTGACLLLALLIYMLVRGTGTRKYS